MKKSFFFKTLDEKYEKTIRGATGQRVYDSLELKDLIHRSYLGGIVTTCVTKFKTQKELDEFISEVEV